VCEERHVRDVFNLLNESRIFGTNVGSLVSSGNSRRPTDYAKEKKLYQLPSWWDDFWMNYGPLYPQFISPERYCWKYDDQLLTVSAEAVLFVNGRFTQSTLEQCLQVCVISPFLSHY
jgi:hypothetical protein